MSKKLSCLKDDLLLFYVVKEVQKRGVVGEEDTILALVNKIMLRCVVDCDPTSSNIIVTDLSGGGKDFLVSSVCNTVLNGDSYFHRTYLTPRVFVYWQQDWNGKVLHVEDPPEDLLNDCVFKTMASGGSNASVVESQKIRHIAVIGKPVIIVTSLNVCIDVEGIRRWDSINLDTSYDLTKAVVKSGFGGFGDREKVDKDLCKVLSDIPFKRVDIPFKDKLYDLFGSNLVSRTRYKRLIDYISASAVLHQFQRKIVNDVVVANWFDFEYGRFCYNKFNNNSGVVLNKIEKEFLDCLDLYEFKKISDISSHFSRSKRWIYRNFERLKSLNVILESYKFDENANKEVLCLCKNEFAVCNDIFSSKELCGDEIYFNRFNDIIVNINDNRKLYDLPVLNYS